MIGGGEGHSEEVLADGLEGEIKRLIVFLFGREVDLGILGWDLFVVSGGVLFLRHDDCQ